MGAANAAFAPGDFKLPVAISQRVSIALRLRIPRDAEHPITISKWLSSRRTNSTAGGPDCTIPIIVVVAAVDQVHGFGRDAPRFVDLRTGFQFQQKRGVGMIQPVRGQIARAKIPPAEARRKAMEITEPCGSEKRQRASLRAIA
jgi:hypothetical protein